MYVEWYGAWNLLRYVLTMVVCMCFIFVLCVVYGIGICVDVCCLFHESRCCWVSCHVM